MINVFKTLNPLNVLWLAIILFALRAGYLFNAPAKLEFAFAEPFNRLLLPFPTQYPFSSFINVILAAILVFAQALLLNYLVNQYNLLGKPTFLPALMYVTLSSLFTPFLVLSTPLICNFFILWMLFRMLGFYKSIDAKSTAYDLGMIVAAGSLIYLPFIYLFLTIWVALIIFKPFNWREVIAGVMGYITIFFFLGVYYYLNSSLQSFYNIWVPLSTGFHASINITDYNYLVLAPVVIIMMLCFFKLRQNFFKSYVQVRKSFQLLFSIFIIAALSFYINTVFHLNHFLLCAAPAAVFCAYYFLYAKGKWFYETLFAVLLASILYFQFNTF